MGRSLLHILNRRSVCLWLAGVVLLLTAGTGRAEVIYGTDIAGTGIYSVDTVNGGPRTQVVTFSPAYAANDAVTLATRPSDGMLFWLDKRAAANPNLWRWNPYTPTVLPVLIGTPGATTTNVIRLGFDATNTLYASNGGATGSLWTLDQNTGAILSVLPLSGATTTAGSGDLCLQLTTGILYMVADQSLYTLDSSGVTTLAGAITGLPANLTGCAFDSKDRLIVSPNSTTAALYVVNIGTRVATALPATPGIAFGDLSTAPGRSADVRLAMSASNLTPGNSVSYTLTVTNDGPDDTADVRVVDLLPAGLTFVSATASSGSYASGTGIWLVGPLLNGATATLTINATVTGTTPITNTAQVSYSDMPDPDSTPANGIAGEDDQASVTVTPSPDLRVVKAATGSFAVDSDATYTLTVNNLLGSLTTGTNTYTVTDIMPPGLTISVLPPAGPTGTGWNCAASTATQLSCYSSTAIAAGATSANPITLTVRPDATATPSVTNTATVSGGGEPLSNSGNNSTTVTTPVCTAGGCPDLVVTKSVTAGMAVGSTSTYTLGVTNTGGLSTGAYTYTIDDILPTGLTLNAVPTVGASGWVCPPAAPVNTVGGTRVTCSRATALLPGAASPTFTFAVNVANPAAPSVTNTATVSGGGEAAAVTGNNATSVTSAVSSFDLRLVMTQAVAGNFTMDTNAQYTLTLTNIGALTAPLGYTITDVLPAGLTYVSATGTGWTCSMAVVGGLQTVTCVRTVPAALGAGLANPAITLTVTPTAAVVPSVTNSATVSYAVATESPNLLANNTSSVTTRVNAPDLTVSKSHNGNFIVGTNGVYTLTVNNLGARATSTSNVVVTDTLPAGLTYVSAAPVAPDTTWSCGAVGQVVTCTRLAANTIAANSSSTPIVVTVLPTAAAVPAVTNHVSVAGGNEPAYYATNNDKDDFTNVYITPTMTKQFLPNSVVAGIPSKLTLTITNPAANSVGLTGLAVTDVFPAGMSVAPTPNFVNNCGGAVSPGQSQGDTLLSLSGGTLAVGMSCTVEVDVVSTTVGANINTTGAVTTSNSGTGGTATATLTVTSPGSPMLSKLSSPDPVGVNQNALLTFRITNKATATNNMGFTDTLPANVVVAAPATFGGTCTSTVAPALARTATAGGSTITVTGVDMAAGAAPCTVTINVTSSVPGSYNNNGTTNISALAGGLLATNVNDTLNVVGTTLTKSFAPAAIPVNGTATLTFTIANGTGNPAQSGLTFTETLPVLPAAGFTVKSTPLASQCNGTVTAPAGGNTITLTGGTMSLGQSSCTVSVDVTATTAGTYVNLPARVSGLSTGMTNGIPAGGVTLTVNPPPTLATAFTPTEAGVGQTSQLTFTISNSATTPAQSGLGFTTTLPANLVLANNVTANTCNGSLSDAANTPLAANATSIKLTGGTMPAGAASCSITVNVKSIVPGSYAIGYPAQITAAAGGLDITGATAPTPLTVRGTTLTKAFSPAVTALNDPVTLTFTITNSGGNPAQSGLSFTDTLGGMTLSAVPASPQCGGVVSGSIGGNVAGFTGGTLGAGVTSCTIVFTGVASAAGSYVNNAANMSNISPGMTNSVNATLTVNDLPTLTKAFSSGIAAIGQPRTLTFTITNPAGASAKTGLTFTDTFPAGLVIASPSNYLNGCGGSPTPAAPTPGAGSFVIGGAGVNAAFNALLPTTCTISVDVSSAAAGSYTNGFGQITAIAGMNNDVTAQTLTVTAPPTITKTMLPAAVEANENATLTFTLNNPNASGSFTNCVIADTFDALPYPNGLSVGTPATTGGSCAGVVNTLVYKAKSLSLTVPALGPGSCTVTVPITSGEAGTFANTVNPLVCTEASSAAGSGPVSLTVSKQPITFNKTTGGLTVVSPGATITYTMQFTNPNNVEKLTSIVITDDTPKYTTFVSAACNMPPWPATITNCQVTSSPAPGGKGTVTWTLTGTLDPKATGAVSLTVKVD